MRADLHMHSTASDGSLTPEELIERIKEENIKLFALTDHDTVVNSNIMEGLAKKNKISYMKGVEISSTYESEMVHILGYNIDTNNIELRKLIEENERLLNEKDEKSIKLLIKRGYPIDFEDYTNYKHDPKRGGWKSLNFLIDRGICKDIDDFFANIFTKKLKIAFPDFPNPRKVIKIIKDAGGVPVLAHPRYGKSKFSLNYLLENFRNMGIQGIECYHTNHSEEDIKACVDFCKKNNLIITGGSDYHGDLIGKRKLGKPEFFIDKDDLIKMINK